jgi:hypothetical protein
MTFLAVAKDEVFVVTDKDENNVYSVTKDKGLLYACKHKEKELESVLRHLTHLVLIHSHS